MHFSSCAVGSSGPSLSQAESPLRNQWDMTEIYQRDGPVRRRLDARKKLSMLPIITAVRPWRTWIHFSKNVTKSPSHLDTKCLILQKSSGQRAPPPILLWSINSRKQTLWFWMSVHYKACRIGWCQPIWRQMHCKLWWAIYLFIVCSHVCCHISFLQKLISSAKYQAWKPAPPSPQGVFFSLHAAVTSQWHECTLKSLKVNKGPELLREHHTDLPTLPQQTMFLCFIYLFFDRERIAIYFFKSWGPFFTPGFWHDWVFSDSFVSQRFPEQVHTVSVEFSAAFSCGHLQADKRTIFGVDSHYVWQIMLSCNACEDGPTFSPSLHSEQGIQNWVQRGLKSYGSQPEELLW